MAPRVLFKFDMPHARWSLLAPLALLLPLSASGCGGCPWVDTSEVSVSPQTPCLELEVPTGDGAPGATGGCVNPVLVGTNRCDQTLTLPASLAADGEVMEVAAGAEVDYELPLDEGVLDSDDHFTFVVPASLGDDQVAIYFTTY